MFDDILETMNNVQVNTGHRCDVNHSVVKMD